MKAPTHACRVAVAAICLAAAACSPAGARVFGTAPAAGLEGFQQADGAITVRRDGDLVDPYFATRALLVAHRSGLPVRDAAASWIAWLLPRQGDDGLFHRYCRVGGDWTACRDADADDALLAIWIELLQAMAPDTGPPAAWVRSADLARRRLAGLLDARLGVFLIAPGRDVALFMDNVEIYAALQSTAADLRRMGRPASARARRREAGRLRARIERVFRPAGGGDWRVSTQAVAAGGFYPDVVAQLYPALFGMPEQGATPRARLDDWLARYGTAWLSLGQDHYPWGLVALAAARLGRCDVAMRWADAAAPLRSTDRWNVLEEVALVALRGPAGVPDVAAGCGETLRTENATEAPATTPARHATHEESAST